MIADVESPYAAPTEDGLRRNILYARIACRWALDAGYYPYASHLFFTQPGILDDSDPDERQTGIDAGKAIIRHSAKISLFFLDLGESSGMRYGREAAQSVGREIKEVRLFDNNACIETYRELIDIAASQGLLPGGYSRDGW